MKKIIYALIIPILFITRVKADTSCYFRPYYDELSYNIDIADNYSTQVNNLISYYNSNLSSTFPYYYIYRYGITINGVSDNRIVLATLHSSSFRANYSNPGPSVPSFSEYYPSNSYVQNFIYYYSITNDTYTLEERGGNRTISNLPYLSSVPLTFVSSNDYHFCSDMTIPSYSNLDQDISFPQYDIYNGDTIPTYMSLTNGQPSADFTEVDMSQYDYIILSLKNYDTTTFNTTIYSFGRLCFTPVYNYGMTPKQDYVNGYQTQGCTENYSSLTPVPIYIIQADLNNHAVYYIKRYENETNILQIPTSIFDITYVTSQNANNPQVSIGGRSYPAIPYSQLTDTANISTNEGYVSGQVCAVGDVNCVAEASGIPIDDLFSNPLHLLQIVWTSILSVFNVIGSFISILPPTLQAFLYTSFMLGIILGILKILL